MSRKPDLQVPTPRLPPEKAEEVLAELERVLGNPLFRGSRRCQSLLRRITEQTVSGEVDSLKERALGVEVFGRPADYDTSQDPVVRASAAEIRKKLAQYYQEAGHESETRIELLPGSYLAEFHFIGDKPVATVRLPKTKPRQRSLIAIAVASAAVLILAAALGTVNWRRSELDDLWGPVLKAPGTVLVCIGVQAAYNLRSAQGQDEIQGIIQPSAAAARRPIQEEDLVLLRDRYVALDDALCLVRLTTLLDRYRKPYRIRAVRSTSFADLRDTPAVLIGAFDNPWTLRTADQLRFTFRKDSEQDTGMVHDSQHPENSEWKLTRYWPNWDVPVDYAIVTRMVDTTTDRPVIIAAGLTQYGTVGAGEFLSNLDYFSEAARRLPKDWQKKNLQIVLSVPVVNRISGRPRILATHVW
ncbi:MAG TPA: hypothetical protein VMJ75_21010 [Candidatus Acidoferrales bacterium]|nr:hypothetical protein [Candidatus Acidoferrales bacterium]